MAACVAAATAVCVPVSDRFPVVSCAAATVDVANEAEAEVETGAEIELEEYSVDV